MEKEKYSRTQDIDGNESSKRVLGFRLANVGIMMGLIYFLVSITMAILQRKFEYVFPAEIFWGFIVGGCSSIGVSLAERFSIKKSRL